MKNLKLIEINSLYGRVKNIITNRKIIQIFDFN